MKVYISERYREWLTKAKSLISSPLYILEVGIATSLLIVSIWWQNTLSIYNETHSIHSAVGDIMFSIIPKTDLSFIFLGGAWAMFFMGASYTIVKTPEKIPAVILAYSLFFIIRGICIASTHIGIPPDHVIPTMKGIEIVNFFRNDLFFSGHTGVPFLAALLVWKDRVWRYIFLLTSVIMAYTVLSMRLHYTIDVIGAYFITYGIFHIAEYLYTRTSSLRVKYHAEQNKNNPPINKNN